MRLKYDFFIKYALDDGYIHKKTVLKMMLLTGLRTAEMHGLKWSDVDFDNKVIHVRRNRLYSRHIGIYEKEPKTKSSKRDIPLTDNLIADLRHYFDWFKQADKKLRKQAR